MYIPWDPPLVLQIANLLIVKIVGQQFKQHYAMLLRYASLHISLAFLIVLNIPWKCLSHSMPKE